MKIMGINYFKNILFCCEIFDKKNNNPDLANIKDVCGKLMEHFNFFF